MRHQRTASGEILRECDIKRDVGNGKSGTAQGTLSDKSFMALGTDGAPSADEGQRRWFLLVYKERGYAHTLV